MAESEDQLTRIVEALLSLEDRSRGRVVVRELVRLRHERTSTRDFPLGREYRAFVLRERIVGLGYYWEGADPFNTLTAEEERAVRALATEAARRLGTPYAAVDIGKTMQGNWIVIEFGDAQFSGVSQIPLIALWHNLRQAADNV